MNGAELIAEASARFIDRMGDKVRENFARNTSRPRRGVLPLFRSLGGERDVVLLGAGPTVTPARLAHLRAAHEAGKFVAVAVNRISAWVSWADYVILISPQDDAARVPWGKPAGELIASTSASPAAVETWPGPVRFFNPETLDGPASLLWDAERTTGPLGRMIPQGMAHAQALEFADYLGAGRVYCMGFDFCYHKGRADFTGAPPAADRIFRAEGFPALTNPNLFMAWELWKNLASQPRFKDRVKNLAPIGLWE